MATNKTIDPTNVTVQIPEMTDKPNQATNSNCLDKIIDGVNANNSNILPIRCGVANYTGLKGGGWADRVVVDIPFSSPMPNAGYDVFATVAGAYGDFHFITCTPDNSNSTVNGTKIILINHSGGSTGVDGQIYWLAIGRK